MTTSRNTLRNLFIGALALIALFAISGSALFLTSPISAQVDETALVEGEGPRQRPGRGERENLLADYLTKEDMTQVVADTLGLTVEELAAEKEAGKRLSEIAEEQGVSMEEIQAAKQAVKEAAVAEALADGAITEEQAERILSNEGRGSRGQGQRGQGRPTDGEAPALPDAPADA